MESNKIESNLSMNLSEEIQKLVSQFGTVTFSFLVLEMRKFGYSEQQTRTEIQNLITFGELKLTDELKVCMKNK